MLENPNFVSPPVGWLSVCSLPPFLSGKLWLWNAPFHTALRFSPVTLSLSFNFPHRTKTTYALTLLCVCQILRILNSLLNTDTCTHAETHSFIAHMDTHTHRHTYDVHIYTHADKYTQTQTCTHLYVHTCTYILSLSHTYTPLNLHRLFYLQMRALIFLKYF